MYSQPNKKKQNSVLKTDSLNKILSDPNNQKLQSRQQQILHIVKNKLTVNFNRNRGSSSNSIISGENSNSVNYNYKPKIQSSKLLGLKETRSFTPYSYNVHSYNPSVSPSEEVLSWADKHTVDGSFVRKSPRTIRLRANQSNKVEDILNKTKAYEPKKHEQIKPNQNESNDVNDRLDVFESVEKIEEKEKITLNDLIATQKQEIRERIQKAIRDGKIFLIRADIPYLNTILENRGWIKKYESRKTRHLPYGNFSNLGPTLSLGDLQYSDNSLNEEAFIYHELRNITPNFIWDSRSDFIQWKGNMMPDTYLNRLDKALAYTSKLGLAMHLEKWYWFFEEDVSDVYFPRSYNASKDKDAFIQDYRNTAALSLVRWFIEQVDQNGLNQDYGYQLTRPLKFAIERCEEIVAIAGNADLDSNFRHISANEWNWFIDMYTKFVHNEDVKTYNELKKNENYEHLDVTKLYDKAVNITNQVQLCDSQYELSGTKNIWILKPNLSSCGYGIMMTHKLENILAKIDQASRNHFLVQKYIEKPLLVKNTKFDVRHWFLVTNNPLTIWIYKESLLRFSSRPFTFENYHEIVHICNTAVQTKYSDQKDPLRTLNWDCDKLNSYLKESYPNHMCEPWYDTIYPKIRQAIISAMLTAQNKIDTRKNSFELYGADFVIMDDFSVWLIEINTNPRTHPPSNNITERLYPDLLDSLIKVIFDYPLDHQAETGNFELLYQQPADTCVKLNENLELTVYGRKISKTEIFLLDGQINQVQLDGQLKSTNE